MTTRTAPAAHIPQEVPSNLFKPKEPFMATVLENRKLTTDESVNDVRHLVFNLEGSGLWYLDGQSLGVLPPGQTVEGKDHKLRLYSIASPGKGDDGEGKTATLCVKRLVYEDENGQEVKGVCSNYLCDLKPGDQVPVTGPVGKAFLLPEQENAHMIMVATGTGIAPFRGFLKTRYTDWAHETGETHLFFGCQKSCDLLYYDEMEAYKGFKTFNLHTAISREQENAQGQRMYVQHRIHEQAAHIFELLEKPNTYFYMCGLKGMEPGIMQAMEEAATAQGKHWPDLLARLQAEKRWHVEVY